MAPPRARGTSAWRMARILSSWVRTSRPPTRLITDSNAAATDFVAILLYARFRPRTGH